MLLSNLQEALDRPLKNGFDDILESDEVKNKVNYFNSLNNHKDKNDNENIVNYCSSGADRINRELWDAKLSKSKLHNHNEAIHAIQKTIYSTHPSDENHTLYTGVRDSTIKRGDIIHAPSFISTSLNPRIAYKFAKAKKYFNNGIQHYTILKIQTRKGQKMLNASDYTMLPTEREVILPANQLLKIKSTKIYHDSTGNPIHVHTAQIMTPSEIEEHKNHPEVISHLRMKKELNL